MRLFCWPKILLDTKVNTNSARLKPNSASFGLWKGLRHFRNTKQSRVEAPCRVFTARRHGELNVMDSADRAFGGIWRHLAGSHRRRRQPRGGRVDDQS